MKPPKGCDWRFFLSGAVCRHGQVVCKVDCPSIVFGDLAGQEPSFVKCRRIIARGSGNKVWRG